MLVVPPLRGSDTAGEGHFGAPRSGGRVHKGLDLEVIPGQAVLCPFKGVVYKIGTSHHWMQYVEVQYAKDPNLFIRFHYVKPSIKKGNTVGGLTFIGLAQDVTRTYQNPKAGDKPHLHLEIWKGRRDKGGERVDPEPYLRSALARVGIPFV